MPIIAQEYLAIKNVFTRYGDSSTGRQKATETLRNILKFWYGDAYTFNFYGNAVDSNGYITQYLTDRFEALNPLYAADTLTALAQITSENLLNIVFLQDVNPSYRYPYGYTEFRIAPYDITDRHEFLPLGLKNLKYRGCKLTATGINANSAQTTDGGPVVKVTTVNQNQIVFSNNNITTARSNISGLPVRQLTSADIFAGTGRISSARTDAPSNFG